MKVKMSLSVPEAIYEELRKRSFEERITMSQIVTELVDAKASPNFPAEKISEVTAEELDRASERVVEKYAGVCKHGFMKGLCKKGCK